MNHPIVITRVRRQYRIVHGYYRTSCKSFEPDELRKVLKALDLKTNDESRLQQATERFLLLEKRSIEKFGPWTTFRIWRVDDRTLQVEFDATYTELTSKLNGDSALKQCLARLGANELLLDDLRRDLKQFRQAEARQAK